MWVACALTAGYRQRNQYTKTNPEPEHKAPAPEQITEPEPNPEHDPSPEPELIPWPEYYEPTRTINKIKCIKKDADLTGSKRFDDISH